VGSFFGAPFYILINRQYMRSFPKDLDAAARIDDCSRLGIYWRIILPLSKPVLLLYFFFQKQLIGGIASVGLKG